jgi:UDP-glucose 4-epimerase
VRVVVTGGAGFIGANLVRRLLDGGAGGGAAGGSGGAAGSADIEVVVVDDLSTGFRANLAACPQAQLLEGTILDDAVLDEAIAGADAIVHLAAVPSVPRSIAAPGPSHDANATGTLKVLEAARRAGNVHTIVASSSSVYGANPTLPKSEDLRPAPLSPYAVSKLAAESYTLAFQHCYALPTLAFRFFNVFGPLQAPGHAYAAVVPTFLDHALNDRPLPVHGDGEQSRDFTYVGTVTAVLADAITRTVTHPEPVNLAFGTRRTLNEAIAELEHQLGRTLPIDRQPPRHGDVRHSQADQTRLLKLFPDVRPIPFEDGLAATIHWFRSR